MNLFVVWTRSGSRRHAAILPRTTTLCGREHMGFAAPTSGATAPRFRPSVARDDNTCRICIREYERKRP